MSGIGISGHFGFAPESSGGVPAAATAYMELTSESLSETFDRYPLANIVGRYSEPDDMAGIKRVAGDIVAPFHPAVAGRLLRGVFQTPVTTATVSGSLWQHSFKSRNTGNWDNRFPNQPYTFEVFRDVGSAQQYRGVQIRTMELQTAVNQEVRMSLGILGMGGTDIAATSPTFPSAPRFPFTFNQVAIYVGSDQFYDAEAFAYSLDSNFEAIATLNGTTDIQKFRRNGEIMHRWSMTVGFETIEHLTRFRAQSEFALKAITTMANSHQLIIDLPRCVTEGHPTGMSGRGRQTVELTGMARYHVGSAVSAEVKLTTSTQSA